ncbi:MAG: AAA family ATPase, partial [Lachnospiraceae bacterium]|nr:AAA family ATPase [Lachnospiraceae bacterium]
MVDITDRIKTIRDMVDSGKYLCVNRARQYGKTTTLFALERILSEKYYVVSMDFQDYGAETFQDADSFCRDFIDEFCALLSKRAEPCTGDLEGAIQELAAMSENYDRELRLFTMFKGIKRVWDASDKPIVLFIDEVDSATNNQLFIDFLAILRSHYLKRQKEPEYRTFQSVILAGVTDVKHLKSKIRDEANAKENSPWNIAADFAIDMSLPEDGIRGMLDEYEADHHTGMNIEAISRKIREYTNGYPFLVSRICELIDTNVAKKFGSEKSAWTDQGLDEAIRLILSESNTLFDSLTSKLNNYPDIKSSLRSMLMEGAKLAYN